MKRGSILFVLLSVLSINSAYAAAGDQYLLPKFGAMSINIEEVDPLISFGVMWGYGLSDNVSFEAEFNSGFSGGKYNDVDTTTPSTPVTIDGQYRVMTIAGYLVHRYPMGEASYLKTKFGLLYEEVEKTVTINTATPITTVTKKDGTGIAGGIGMGTAIGHRLTLEFEVTVIDKDIIFYSFGTHYKF